MPSHTSDSPAKKQSKWSPEEDALIIELRGSGMKWDDISKRLPGRSSISCRLHYQNYLERRSEWDEERKNKLARLYERFKPEMWAKVAEEMQVPWRAAEAMHWQLGETDMARRAGVVPFSLNMSSNEPQGPPLHRMSPTRGHAHSQSQGSLPRDLSSLPSPRYTRGGPPPLMIPPPTPTTALSRPLTSRRESLPPHPFGGPLPEHQPPDYGYGQPLAPILHPPTQPPPPPPLPPAPLSSGTHHHHRSTMSTLPSLAELTTGVSPYETPAYTVGSPPPMHSHPHSHSSSTASPRSRSRPLPRPGPAPAPAPAPSAGGAGLLPALSPYPPHPHPHLQHAPPLEPSASAAAAAAVGKRRASPPDVGAVRETSRRRHLLHHPVSSSSSASASPAVSALTAAAAALPRSSASVVAAAAEDGGTGAYAAGQGFGTMVGGGNGGGSSNGGSGGGGVAGGGGMGMGMGMGPAATVPTRRGTGTR